MCGNGYNRRPVFSPRPGRLEKLRFVQNKPPKLEAERDLRGYIVRPFTLLERKQNLETGKFSTDRQLTWRSDFHLSVSWYLKEFRQLTYITDIYLPLHRDLEGWTDAEASKPLGWAAPCHVTGRKEESKQAQNVSPMAP